MYGCECCISARIIHSSLLSWRNRYLKNSNIKAKNAQNRRSGEKSNRIYETYKNIVIPHGHRIYAKASGMEKAIMCAYPQSDHELPHCKSVLQFCAKCPCVNLPDQETDDKYSDTRASIRFHIYHLIARCTIHGRLPFNDRKICYMCKQDYSSEQPINIYTRKELVMMETKISNFHTSFHILAIQKL